MTTTSMVVEIGGNSFQLSIGSAQLEKHFKSHKEKRGSVSYEREEVWKFARSCLFEWLEFCKSKEVTPNY